jgi:uncharacterized membrane protein
MADRIALLLFILFLSVGMGGGLYETLVVYPNWKTDPTPQNLAEKLQNSGQTLAGRRFWPFISPVTTLLAILNLCIAWQQPGQLRTLWLAAAIVILVKSIATYTYFVPTMVRKLAKSTQMKPAELTRTVRQWTSLSPLRLGMELFGWVTAIWTWSLLGRV